MKPRTQPTFSFWLNRIGWKVAFLLSTLGTLLLLWALWLGIPTVQTLWGWFWRMHSAKLSGRATVFLACFLVVSFGGAFLVIAAIKNARRRRLALAILMATGFLQQHALALASGHGLDEMRARILFTGHAEFAVTASRSIGLWTAAAQYEELVKMPGQRFSQSKPPGQLLFYCGAAIIADRLMPLLFDPPLPEHNPRIVDRRHYRLVNFATIFFPLISVMVLAPLMYLGECFLGSMRAAWPAFLYLLVPGHALIQLHLDQVLYPLLAVSYWAAIAAAVTKPRYSTLWWLSSGAICWISFFVSFSLIPILLVGVAVGLALEHENTIVSRSRNLVRGILLSSVSWLTCGILAYAVVGYVPWVAYTRSIAHHTQWKHWDESFRWPAAQLNVVEMAYWLGLSFAMLLIFQATYGWRRILRIPPTLVASAVLLVILILAAFGRTVGEVARLWLFLTPMISIAAAAAILRIRFFTPRWRLGIVATLQLVWTVGLKAFEDFR